MPCMGWRGREQAMAELTRRLVLGGAAGVLSAPFVIPARAEEVLTISAFGGEFHDIFVKNVLAPFEQKFGVKVIYDEGGGLAYYTRIRAAQGSPGFDVAAEISAPDIILGAKEGLLEKITEREVPNLR